VPEATEAEAEPEPAPKLKGGPWRSEWGTPEPEAAAEPEVAEAGPGKLAVVKVA